MITAHASMVTKTTIVKLLLGIGLIVQSIFGVSLYAQES